VCNWGEYISDGAESSMDVVAEFERATGIQVNYTTFDTNETLYSKLAGGGADYDVIIPSDYMIERLIAENRLLPLDYTQIPNYKYIMDDYKGLFFDPDEKYTVPYTIGMVGLIYNSALVKTPPTSWAAMWDPQYKGQILQFASPRDAFGTAQYLLGQDINSSDPNEWKAAAAKLRQQAPLVQSYVADEIYNIMEGGNAVIGPYYAGDFLLMRDNNADLAFVYPEEGTNFFYDSMCIPKDAKHVRAAQLFINFMLEPQVALANAEYIMYATPHSAVRENPDYTLKDDEYLYPATPPKIQIFHHLPQEILTLMNTLWTQVKL
jgi:spermidine/putrescine transport system substrate-binding protein